MVGWRGELRIGLCDWLESGLVVGGEGLRIGTYRVAIGRRLANGGLERVSGG